MPRTLNPTSVPSEDTIIPWTHPPHPPEKNYRSAHDDSYVYFYRNHFTTICYIEIQ